MPYYIAITLMFRGSGSVRLNTIRVNTKYSEIIEVKRYFKHPLYKFGRAYDDIVLVELGRRIVYDYDIFGDSPTCIDLGKFHPPIGIKVEFELEDEPAWRALKEHADLLEPK